MAEYNTITEQCYGTYRISSFCRLAPIYRLPRFTAGGQKVNVPISAGPRTLSIDGSRSTNELETETVLVKLYTFINSSFVTCTTTYCFV